METAIESRENATTSAAAMQLALDWAEGRRSWANLGSPHEGGPYTPDVIAAMDAQEVVKWTAVAVAFRAMERGVSDTGAVRALAESWEGQAAEHESLALPENARSVEDRVEARRSAARLRARAQELRDAMGTSVDAV